MLKHGACIGWCNQKADACDQELSVSINLSISEYAENVLQFITFADYWFVGSFTSFSFQTYFSTA